MRDQSSHRRTPVGAQEVVVLGVDRLKLDAKLFCQTFARSRSAGPRRTPPRTDRSTVAHRRHIWGTRHIRVARRVLVRIAEPLAVNARLLRATLEAATLWRRDEVVPRPVPDGATVGLPVERVEHEPVNLHGPRSSYLRKPTGARHMICSSSCCFPWRYAPGTSNGHMC